MRSIKDGVALAMCGVASMTFTASAAAQQEYPQRPIRWIVPYTPSGPTDIHSRTVAQKLNAAWGQPVVVENRPGASGMIGTHLAAAAPADGYTLCTATIPFTTAASLNPKLPFSPSSDLVPIALLGAVPNIVVVHPSVPVRTVKELVAFARARPGQLFYPTGGIGGAQSLAVAFFEHLSGTEMVAVGYKGGIPGITALVAGDVSVGFTDLMTTLPQAEAGKLRLLAVTSAKRSPIVPDTPTVAESGLPGYGVTAWFGLVTRAGTPRPIVEKLNREVLKILQMPDVNKRLSALGSEAGTLTPEQFAQFLQSEREKWANVIKTSAFRRQQVK